MGTTSPERILIFTATYNERDNISVLVPKIDAVLDGHKYEIVVVDDGSTDRLNDVISQYNDLNNLRFVSQRNQGPGAARNLGVANAKSSLIAFIDAWSTRFPLNGTAARSNIRAALSAGI